jgi:hypothetical protein
LTASPRARNRARITRPSSNSGSSRAVTAHEGIATRAKAMRGLGSASP